MESHNHIFKVGDRVKFVSERCKPEDSLSKQNMFDDKIYTIDLVHRTFDKIGFDETGGWHNVYLFEPASTEFKIGDIVEITACLSTTSPLSYNTQYVVDDVDDDLNKISVATLMEYWPMDWFKLHEEPKKEEIMSKELKVSEEFVLEAYKAACTDWKKKLENQFPDVFANKNLIKEDLESFTVNKSVDTNVFGITISDAWAKDNENFRLKSIGFNNYKTLAIVNFSGIDLIIPVKEKIPSNIIDGEKIVAYINKGRFEVAV